MKTSRTSIVFFLLLFISSFLQAQSNNNPTIAVCNGQQYICASDTLVTLCVNIIVNPAYPNAGIISEFEISWGDGSPNTIVPGSLNPPSQTHVYNVGNFFGSCTYEREYIIKLLTKHSNPAVEPANSAFFLYIRNPPQADFTISPNPVCTNKPITLNTIPCPAQGITFQSWTLDGSVTGTGPTITHTFTTPGIKPLQHCVGNVCDTICSTRTLSVIDAAVANLVADSGVLVGTANPYRVCLDGGSAIVRLNASNSLNVTKPYKWMIMPSFGWQWVPAGSPNTSISRVRFTAPGTYTVTVKVNNDCDEENAQSITIEVVEAPVLLLNKFPDTCVAVAYSPSPMIPGATYTINGIPQPDFPVMLQPSNDPYFIKATLLNECGNQMLHDTILILPPQDISIISPADLTVCAGGDSIALQASLTGIWSGGGSLISTTGPDTLFNPATAGTYHLVISRGYGVCRRADTTTIVVQEAYPLVLNSPPQGCISVDYSPDPYDPAVAYTINGNPQSTFPVILDAAGAPYTITATANNTCGDVVKTATLDITVPVDVQILAPNDTIICSGTAAIPLFASDTIGTWSGPNIEITPQGPVFNPVAAGTFTLIFERGTGLCRRADSIDIKVEPGNGVNAGADQYLCITQGTLNLGGGTPSGGTYSGPGVNGNTIDLAQLTLDTTYTYLYTISTLPDACNDDAFNLTVSGPPDGGFATSRDTACVGQTVTITPIATANVNYAIDWGDNSTGSGLDHAYATPGTFQISYTVSTTNPLTGGVLCSSSGATSVHILEPIDTDNIRFDMSPDSGCAPLTVSFTNLSYAENGRYSWDFGNGTGFTGYQPGPVTFEQGIEDTTYTVRLIVDNGCDSLVFSRTVKVFPQPRANFGITYLEPCSGGILEASTLSTGNPSSNLFYTSTGIQKQGSLTAPTFFQFYTDSLPDTVGIWLVSSNFCGVDTAYREVVVNPPDVVALIGLPDTTSICAGETVPIINYSTTGAPIFWAVSDGNTYLGDTILVSFSNPGTYSIALYAFGCGFDSMVIPVTILPLPTLDVEHDLIKCPGDPVSFQVNSNAPGILLWFGDGDSTDQKISQQIFQAPGTYLPQATAVSAQGCEADWSGSLTILTPPEAMATADDSLCADVKAVFSGSSNMAGSSCSWNFGDGNQSDDCQTEHSFVAPGLYTAVLTVVSSQGCRGTDTIPVYVRNRPDAQFDYTIVKPCSPAVVTFKSNASGATGLDWKLGDGSVSSLTTFQHTYTNGGAYTVQFIATNEGICSDTTQQTITVFQTPVFDFDIDPQCTVAEGTELQVITDAFNYVLVSGPNYSATGDFHDSLATGTYAIQITSPDGCENDTSLFLLPPNELFLSVAEDSFDILLGDSIRLEAKVNQSGVQFRWTPPLYLTSDTISNPSARPFRSIVYTVVGTNLLNCSKTDTIWVQVHINRDTGLFIPNAFTPNADGINDIFYVRSSNPSVARYEVFQVFDKYDEKVFDVHNISGGEKAVPDNPVWGWDGNFRGGKAEMGSYRYVITLLYVDGEKRTATGTLQLIR